MHHQKPEFGQLLLATAHMLPQSCWGHSWWHLCGKGKREEEEQKQREEAEKAGEEEHEDEEQMGRAGQKSVKNNETGLPQSLFWGVFS